MGTISSGSSHLANYDFLVVVSHLQEEMLLTGESFSVNQTVTADEVLRLLEQEGQDMDRVLQRLMALKGGMEALMSVDVNGHPTERK